MLRKKSSEKSEKNVLYIHTNIVTKKWGGKRAKQFFQKHKNSAIKKCMEKIAGKSAKKVFLYSYDYRDQKWGEKRAKQFFQKHKISASKKCW